MNGAYFYMYVNYCVALRGGDLTVESSVEELRRQAKTGRSAEDVGKPVVRSCVGRPPPPLPVGPYQSLFWKQLPRWTLMTRAGRKLF